MTEKPATYDELVTRNRRLANIIVSNNHLNEDLLRAEVKKAKAQAWEEGYTVGNAHNGRRDANPYKINHG